MAELHRVLEQHQPLVVGRAVLEHLRSCPGCRGRLFTLIAILAPEYINNAESGECDPCEADLAAYIDLEQQDAQLAVRIYPHVWLHLWFCERCLHVYDLVKATMMDPHLPDISRAEAPRPSMQSTAVVQRIRVTRKALALIVPPRLAVAPVFRGRDDHGHVVYDDYHDEGDGESRQITISIQLMSDGGSMLSVTVLPPIAGKAIVLIGEQLFEAIFQGDGSARFDSIPAEMIVAPDAPDLEISIVTSDDDSSLHAD